MTSKNLTVNDGEMVVVEPFCISEDGSMELDFNYGALEHSKGQHDVIYIERKDCDLYEQHTMAISVNQAEWLVGNLPNIINALKCNAENEGDVDK